MQTCPGQLQSLGRTIRLAESLSTSLLPLTNYCVYQDWLRFCPKYIVLLIKHFACPYSHANLGDVQRLDYKHSKSTTWPSCYRAIIKCIIVTTFNQIKEVARLIFETMETFVTVVCLVLMLGGSAHRLYSTVDKIPNTLQWGTIL